MAASVRSCKIILEIRTRYVSAEGDECLEDIPVDGVSAVGGNDCYDIGGICGTRICNALGVGRYVIRGATDDEACLEEEIFLLVEDQTR